MTYISICKRCNKDLDRREEVISGVRCDGCGLFAAGMYHHGMPPGWIGIDIGEDDGEGHPQVIEGEAEYIEDRNYCPTCALAMRKQLSDFPLPWSRGDPGRPTP